MPAQGQARSRYRWQTPREPGRIRTVGGDLGIYGGASGLRRVTPTGTGDLLRSSIAGASGLRRVTPTGTGDLLRSRIGGVASYDITRRGTVPISPGAAGGRVSLTGLSAPTGASYKPITVKVSIPGAGAARPSAWAWSGAMPALSSAAITGVGDTLKPGETKPITSLVPAEQGFYRQRMERGDNAFRSGHYAEALSWFKIAASVVRHCPECHLSRAHALFAVGEYHQASYHLQKALEYFPELPLVRLEIRKFYGDKLQGDFDKHVRALQEEVDGPAVTADEPLVLAYVRYFSGETDQAVAALGRAHAVSLRRKDEASQEAVEIFWDAMVVAGKIPGPAGPTSRPASRPAKGRAPAKESGTNGAPRPSGPSPEDRADKADGGKPTSTTKPAGQ